MPMLIAIHQADDCNLALHKFGLYIICVSIKILRHRLRFYQLNSLYIKSFSGFALFGNLSFKRAGLAANSVIGRSFIYHRLVVLLLAEDMHQLKQLDPLLKRPRGL